MNNKRKKIKKIFIYLIIISFIISFNNINIVKEVKAYEIDNPAYDYYMPMNSFGSGIKTVNWSYFTSLFNQHTSWSLDYKRYSYSDLVNGNQYLSVQKWWNNNGFWKINLILDVPVDIYYASFIFGCDLVVLDYVVKDDYRVFINYTANDTEIYSVFFDYSDIMTIPDLIVTKGVTNNLFWFRFSKYNIPSGIYEFDPTFGDISTGSSSQYIYWDSFGREYMRGFYVNCPEDCTVNNMSVYFKTLARTANYSCAIYEYVDHSSSYAGDLIGTTESKEVLNTQDNSWVVFDFVSEPELTGSTNYYICCKIDTDLSFLDDISHNYIGSTASTGWGIYKTSTSGVSYDDPLTGDASTNYNFSIYCSYTVDSGWTNNCPYGDSVSITNNSNSVSLTVGSISLDIHDADGNTTSGTMICPISTDSDSWSNLGNGTRTLTLSTLVCETTYKVWFNFSDEYCTRNYFFYFTTVDCPYENNCPYGDSVSITNNSNSVSLTVGSISLDIHDADGNTTSGTMICPISTDSDSWSGLGNGTRTLTLSTLTCGITYKVWFNFSDEYCTRNYFFYFTTVNCPIDYMFTVTIQYNNSESVYPDITNISFIITSLNGSDMDLELEIYNFSDITNVNVGNGTYYLEFGMENLNFNRSYTVYCNITDDNTVEHNFYAVFDTISISDIESFTLDSVWSGVTFDPETIILMIWLIFVLSIFFGKNKYMYFMCSLFLILEIFVIGSYIDSSIFGIWVVTTLFVVIIGFIRSYIGFIGEQLE